MTVRQDGGCKGDAAAAAHGLDDDHDEWVIPPQLASFAPTFDALRRAQGDDFARQVVGGLESMRPDSERDSRGSDDSDAGRTVGGGAGGGEGASDSPSLASELDGVADPGSTEGKRPACRVLVGSWRTWLVAAAVLAVIVVFVLAGAAVVRHVSLSKLDEASVECGKALSSRSKAWEEVSAVSRRAAAVSKLTDKDVADASTVRALAESVQAKPDDPPSVSCEVGEGKEKLAAAKAESEAQASEYQQWVRRMDSAIRAVKESQEEKQSADRLQALSARIDQADDVYEGSAGRTDGETVREALSKALDAARKVKAMAKPTAEQVDEAVSALDKACDDVNRNMETKRKADEEARAETESQSQSGSQSWSPSYSYQTPDSGTGGGSSSSGGSSSGSSGGGWSVPSPDDGSRLPGTDDSL